MATPTSPTPSSPRMFGGTLDPVRLPWSWATERLEAARTYWIATARRDGRPHTRPVWAVWLEDALHFGTGSLALESLTVGGPLTVHLDSGSEVVILEGRSEPVADPGLLARICDDYNRKYLWDLTPDALPGPLYTLVPDVGFGWISDNSGLDRGSLFHGSATRWRFE